MTEDELVSEAVSATVDNAPEAGFEAYGFAAMDEESGDEPVKIALVSGTVNTEIVLPLPSTSICATTETV
jgi:hypothetical protein